MADDVKEKLRELINTQGKQILSDANKFTSFMLDLCNGNNTREIRILATALNEKIPQHLYSSGNKQLTEELMASLSHRLENETGLRLDAANWAVCTWADALEMVIAEKDTAKSSTPPTLHVNSDDRVRNLYSPEDTGFRSFSKIELRDLAICWLVLGFCFSFQYLIPSRDIPYTQSLARFSVYFVVALICIGMGFLFRELAHKGVAQSFGYHAVFRMWKLGLVIAVACAVITFGHFLFFAPGAVLTTTYKTYDPKEEGLISAAGPLTNIALAGLFYLLAFGSGYDEFRAIVGSFGFQVNLWLAALTIIPLPSLDGIKIWRWNKAAWLALAAVSWVLLGLLMLGVIR